MDVTELKAREQDIQAQAQEKRQLVANEAAAKEASRLKSQFLANVGGDTSDEQTAGANIGGRCLMKFEPPSQA